MPAANLGSKPVHGRPAMSLQIEIAFSVPQETARVAKAAFPKGNVYMTMRDQLGTLFEDEQFADLFPPQGQPAEAPWRLALVTMMQFAENLPDRQATDAVRGHIDWKYAAGLDLTDDGFDYSVLSEFRSRLLQGKAEQQLLDSGRRDSRNATALAPGSKGRFPRASRLGVCVARVMWVRPRRTCRTL